MVSVIIQVESSDLIAYGLIPEFIGRFPILVSLTALTEDQLVQVKLFPYFSCNYLCASWCFSPFLKIAWCHSVSVFLL